MVASCLAVRIKWDLVTTLKVLPVISLSYLSATTSMLKSPFKFLGFGGHAKTPKPNPQNERKMKGPGKLRKVRRPTNTSADRPSISMEKGLRSTVATEGKHSREHYQNQVRTSVSSACNRVVRTMSRCSPQVHRLSAHPISTISIHFHRTHKTMKTTIHLLRY